jgi:hypothetical protein
MFCNFIIGVALVGGIVGGWYIAESIRGEERHTWCEKHETISAYDHCMEHGADAKWGGDGENGGSDDE